MGLPLFSRERGQVLVIAAILLPVLMAMAGMAVDVGGYASERRSLQNAADSIALAAGQELPDASAVQAKAAEYAAEHGVDPSHISVTVSGGDVEPQVRVVIDRSHDFIFMGIVGIENADVGAIAAVGKFSFGGGTGVVPWAIEEDTLLGAASGDEVVIKYDSNGTSPGQGNFGPIRVDGNGGSDYEDATKYGSDYNVCSTGMSNCTATGCPGTYPSSCGENSPECDGSDCPPKTGNMTGSTKDAVDFRMDYTGAGCDTFEEVFTMTSVLRDAGYDADLFAFEDRAPTGGGRLAAPAGHHGAGSHETFTPTAGPPTDTPVPTDTPAPAATSTPPAPTSTPSAPTNTPAATDTPGATNTPGSGGGETYALNGECNPWAGGSCATTTSLCSRRVFLIPVIEAFGNGTSDDVTILGFALVFLEGYDGSCTGSSCDVKVRFVKADINIGAFAGDYDPDAYNHFVKLIE